VSYKSTLEEQNPIIAISTSYDALAVAPELSHSLSATGSGLIGALELSRIFSNLGSELTSIGFKYDLLFILTPSSSLSFEATEKFVDHLQSNIKERVKTVICLD